MCGTLFIGMSHGLFYFAYRFDMYQYLLKNRKKKDILLIKFLYFRTSTTSFRSPNTSISSSASNLFGNNGGQTPKQKSSTLPARAK